MDSNPMSRTTATSGAAPVPGWGFVFGLTGILICVGFFLIYLIFRSKKQEKQIEMVLKRTQQLPSPEELMDMMQQFYYAPQVQQPMMRNVYAMVETRLNDFDEYCRTKYAPLPSSSPAAASDPVSSHAPVPPSSSSPPAQPPPPTQPPPLEEPATLCQSESPHPSPPPQTQRGPSLLTEALPSLLTMITGTLGSGGGNNDHTDSNNGAATIPVLLGDIVNVISNQQSRHARRAVDAPSSEPDARATQQRSE